MLLIFVYFCWFIQQFEPVGMHLADQGSYTPGHSGIGLQSSNMITEVRRDSSDNMPWLTLASGQPKSALTKCWKMLENVGKSTPDGPLLRPGQRRSGFQTSDTMSTELLSTLDSVPGPAPAAIQLIFQVYVF